MKVATGNYDDDFDGDDADNDDLDTWYELPGPQAELVNAPPGYEILDILARSPSSTFYRARQRSLDRIVVLQTVEPRLQGEAIPWGLDRKAAILSRLRHPHLVQLIDRVHDQVHPWLVLEFVDGGDLRSRIRAGAQPARPVAAVIEHVSRTLAYVHRSGIVHRNLKPSKILLASTPSGDSAGDLRVDFEDSYGIPKVGGFRLALDREQPVKEPENVVVGTPVYMAPEQIRGPTHETGPTTDVYALGVILFESLTGRLPFEGQSFGELFEQIVERAPPAPRSLVPSIPRKLARICMRCLEKEPGRRYSSALALASDLRSFRRGSLWRRQPGS